MRRQQGKEKITPEGTRDILFAECREIRAIEAELRRLFEGYGYQEVITPTFEFLDVFAGKSGGIPPESMYKMTDPKGRLLAVRPDSTIPIARLVGTKLKNHPLPLPGQSEYERKIR